MRFFFDLTDDATLIPDEVGVETRDVQHAIAEAEQVIREMKAPGGLTSVDDAWRLTIRDEAGEVAATVSLGGRLRAIPSHQPASPSPSIARSMPVLTPSWRRAHRALGVDDPLTVQAATWRTPLRDPIRDDPRSTHRHPRHNRDEAGRNGRRGVVTC